MVNYLYSVIFISDDGLNGPGVRMDDPRVIAKLKDDYLMPPPNRSLNRIHRYHLDNPEILDTSMGQAEQIKILLKNKVINLFLYWEQFLFHNL